MKKICGEKMIKIKRTDCPPHLSRSELGKDAWSNQKVRKALWEMQHGKCCYCERDIPDHGPLENIEHFRPKGIPQYEHLRNTWGNLLLACVECNQFKSTKFPTTQFDCNQEEIPLFLDPSDPDIYPEQHITFKLEDPDSYDFAFPVKKNESIFGEETILGIDLHSSNDLRATFFSNELYVAYSILNKAKRRGTPKKLDAAIQLFETFLMVDSEFAAFAREWARYKELSDKYNVSIPNDD